MPVFWGHLHFTRRRPSRACDGQSVFSLGGQSVDAPATGRQQSAVPLHLKLGTLHAQVVPHFSFDNESHKQIFSFRDPSREAVQVMSLDIVGYYSQYALAMEGIIQDGYNNAIDSGQIEGFAGDAYRIGRHDGLIGNHYYWDESDCILIGNEDDHARLSARLDGNRIIFAADSALGWVQYLDLITGATYVDDVGWLVRGESIPVSLFHFRAPHPISPAPCLTLVGAH